jgi:IS5 family transposase
MAINGLLQPPQLSQNSFFIIGNRSADMSRSDVTVTHELLHGKEDCVPGDSGYTGADARPELEDDKAAFLIARKRGKAKAIKNARSSDAVGCQRKLDASGGAKRDRLPNH